MHFSIYFIKVFIHFSICFENENIHFSIKQIDHNNDCNNFANVFLCPFANKAIHGIGDLNRGMPEELTDDLDVHAFGEEHTCEGMAQRVDAVGLDVRIL